MSFGWSFERERESEDKMAEKPEVLEAVLKEAVDLVIKDLNEWLLKLLPL